MCFLECSIRESMDFAWLLPLAWLFRPHSRSLLLFAAEGNRGVPVGTAPTHLVTFPHGFCRWLSSSEPMSLFLLFSC